MAELKLTLTPKAAWSKVELDGNDISHFLTSVVVNATVGEMTTATLTYRGAVVVVGECGKAILTQQPLHVVCSDCKKVLGGEAHECVVVETTPLDAQNRTYSVVSA